MSSVTALAEYMDGVPSILQLVTAVLLIGYLVLLFRKPSSEYFAARAVPR